MKTRIAEQLIAEMGGKFSSELGIDLSKADSAELCKWLFASILYGARISGAIAARTYREFEKRSALTPWTIASLGQSALVEILDSGGYARYDYKTATKLSAASETLLAEYSGDLNRLHDAAANQSDLEARIRALAPGIGEVTCAIFLRELRGIWKMADPPPSQPALLAAMALGLIAPGIEARAAQALLARQCRDVARFPELEAALVRYAIANRLLLRRQQLNLKKA